VGVVVEVLAASKGALLMTSVTPGTLIEGLPEVPSPAEPSTGVFLRDLHGAAEPGRAPRKLADWVQAHFAVAAGRGADLTCSRVLFGRLFSTVDEQDVMMLHRELHFGILIRGPRGFVTMGPKGAVGDRHFDAVDYVMESYAVEEMGRRRDALAKKGGRTRSAEAGLVVPDDGPGLGHVRGGSGAQAALLAFAAGEG
jgi:streptomycin 6-kinase